MGSLLVTVRIANTHMCTESPSSRALGHGSMEPSQGSHRMQLKCPWPDHGKVMVPERDITGTSGTCSCGKAWQGCWAPAITPCTSHMNQIAIGSTCGPPEMVMRQGKLVLHNKWKAEQHALRQSGQLSALGMSRSRCACSRTFNRGPAMGAPCTSRHSAPHQNVRTPATTHLLQRQWASQDHTRTAFLCVLAHTQSPLTVVSLIWRSANTWLLAMPQAAHRAMSSSWESP